MAARREEGIAHGFEGVVSKNAVEMGDDWVDGWTDEERGVELDVVAVAHGGDSDGDGACTGGKCRGPSVEPETETWKTGAVNIEARGAEGGSEGG